MPAHVLIVDDDETIREVLTLALEAEGYRVLTAATGEEAVWLATRCPPEIILLDLRLGAEDGRAFIRAYQQSVQTQAPIVLVSAAPDAKTVAARHGLADVVEKPFDLEHVLDLVNRYSKRRT